MFTEDLNQILAFISEAKRTAYRERKSIDWNQTQVDIATYLDNVAGDNWRSTFIPLLEGVMTDTAKQMALSFGSQFDIQNIAALQWFDDYTLVFAQDIVETTKKGVADMTQQAMLEGWTNKQLEDRMALMFTQWRDGSTNSDEWDWYDARMPTYRREMIARTETMRASNYGSFNIMATTGTQKKEWLATADSRTRNSHMQAWSDYGGKARAIPVNQPFLVNGMHMMYPGDPAGGGEGINCRCTFIPSMDSSMENTIPFMDN